jgi:ABC-type multidrug transport system fused ATPase/permease subunit
VVVRTERFLGVLFGMTSRPPCWEWGESEGSPTGGTLVGCLIRGVRGPLIVGIGAGGGTMVFGALVPWLIGRIIDYLMTPGATVRDLGYRCGVLVAVIALGALLGILQERCDTIIRLMTALRTMVWVNHNAVRLAGQRNGYSAGDVINLGIGDVTPIGVGIAGLSRGIGGLTAVLVVAGILLTFSWQLCVVVLVGTVVLLRLNDYFLRPYSRAQRVVRESMAKLTAIALDATSGIRVIKSLGAAEYFTSRYRDRSQQVRRAATAMARAEGVVAGNRVFAAGVLSTVTVWVGATLAMRGTISIGDLIAAYGYAVFLATPLRWILTSHQQWAAAKVSAGRVGAYLDVRPAPAAGATEEGDAMVDPDSGLVAEPGMYTVVASAEGMDWAGLAERLRVRYPDPARVRVIPSDDYLFSGRLGEVLDPVGGAAPRAVTKAMDTAALTDVVQALPDGLDHVVTAGGADFSGGEQQRLRLTRALLAGTSTLVLVDPTNALDASTEVEVARRLRRHRWGSMTVVLSNSPPHLVEADRVVFLDGGRVVAAGAHDELMARPDYQVMVERGEA